MTPPRMIALLLLIGLALFEGRNLDAHERDPVTHSFESESASEGPRLRLRITDASNGETLPARISFQVDGASYVPNWVNEHGIRFTSIHKRSQHLFTAIYALKTGPLEVDLPETANSISVTATHGFEYLPQTVDLSLPLDSAPLELELERWSHLNATGWIGIDEHLHFDRLHPADDTRWMAMLEADGLESGHFMVLKGGMTPGLWAEQFAFGKSGQADNGVQLIIPGQEYRDTAQGHINLLGIGEAIEPYSTGGMGWPAIVENYPPLHDVLSQARDRGGFLGAAHGGSLGNAATAVADALLGKLDFWEISNGFIYQVETWYKLMNCGYFLPPMAGTDLPNSPSRDPWQPMLGSIRTYLFTEGENDYESFKRRMSKGRVFITGGPLLSLTVEGRPIGDTLRIPQSGTVFARAEITSTQPLREFKLVLNGINLETAIHTSFEKGIHKWTLEREIHFDQSGWIAAWGKGTAIKAQNIDAMAHTNAIRVIVNDQPIQSEDDRAYFENQLRERRDYYSEKGVYKNEAQRERAVRLFDQAIAKLRDR